MTPGAVAIWLRIDVICALSVLSLANWAFNKAVNSLFRHVGTLPLPNVARALDAAFSDGNTFTVLLIDDCFRSKSGESARTFFLFAWMKPANCLQLEILDAARSVAASP